MNNNGTISNTPPRGMSTTTHPVILHYQSIPVCKHRRMAMNWREFIAYVEHAQDKTSRRLSCYYAGALGMQRASKKPHLTRPPPSKTTATILRRRCCCCYCFLTRYTTASLKGDGCQGSYSFNLCTWMGTWLLLLLITIILLETHAKVHIRGRFIT